MVNDPYYSVFKQDLFVTDFLGLGSNSSKIFIIRYPKLAIDVFEFLV